MFSIFAKITPKPEFFDNAKQAIVDIIPVTREEQGCQVFNLHELLDTDGTKMLCLYEIFSSEQDYHFHHEQDYTKQVFERYKQWLARPVEINRLSLITL